MTRLARLLGAALLTVAHPASASAAPAKEIVAEAQSDLNGDGVKDRILLLHDPGGEDVDLAIYLSTGGVAPIRPSLYKAAFGWTGDMAGTKPELSVNRAGSLIVVFQNDSIGRDRWRRQFTIAFRGGDLMVAGYDYEARDTLAPGHGGRCDVNFLSGRATRNGKPATLGVLPIIHRLASWTDQSAPAFCDFE